MIEAQLPTLITVIATAAIDSINPCAIGVLILLVSVLMTTHKSIGKMLLFGSLYIFFVFLTYLLAGLGLMQFLTSIPLVITQYIALTVGSLVIIGGLIEIKDYFWYGRWFSLSIPVSMSKKVKQFAHKATGPGVILLGVFVAAVELPCTGGPYLAIIILLSQNFTFTAFLMLVLYNIIFVMPLVIILILVAAGKKITEVKQWKQSSRDYMRLAAGVLLIGLGWLLMLIANGTINFA